MLLYLSKVLICGKDEYYLELVTAERRANFDGNTSCDNFLFSCFIASEMDSVVQ